MSDNCGVFAVQKYFALRLSLFASRKPKVFVQGSGRGRSDFWMACHLPSLIGRGKGSREFEHLPNSGAPGAYQEDENPGGTLPC